MPIESEQDRLDMLEDWGADITLPDTSTIKGIVDRAFVGVVLDDISVEGSDPMAVCSSAEVSSLVEGDAITVANAADPDVDGSYIIKGTEPDGTGMTMLKLRRG